MGNYRTNQFKAGLKIMLDNDPCNIIENEFVKPGKGQAFNRVKIRNLKTGRVVEKTFKSGESVPAADVIEKQMQYLYNDGQFWYFMDQSTYEQCSAGLTAMESAKNWLKEEEINRLAHEHNTRWQQKQDKQNRKTITKQMKTHNTYLRPFSRIRNFDVKLLRGFT